MTCIEQFHMSEHFTGLPVCRNPLVGIHGFRAYLFDAIARVLHYDEELRCIHGSLNRLLARSDPYKYVTLHLQLERASPGRSGRSNDNI